jgi:hypothetical protein
MEFRAARLLFALPAAMQVRLSGRAPVVVDDCVLDPQMQLLLALRDRWRGAPVSELTPDIARRAFRHDTATIAGPPIAVGAVEDLCSRLTTAPSPRAIITPAAAACARCWSITTAAASCSATSTATMACAGGSVVTPTYTCFRSTIV